MKAFYTFFCLMLLLMSCKQEPKQQTTSLPEKQTDAPLLTNEFLIQGQTFNDNYQTVYLYKIGKETNTLLDSAKVADNAFRFKGILKNPAYYSVKTNANDEGFKFLADASTIHLFLNEDLSSSSTFSTSDIQKQYRVYKKALLDYERKGVGLYYGLKGDFSNANINKLKEERTKLFKEQSDFIINFIKENPGSYYSAMLIDDHFGEFGTTQLRDLLDGLSPTVKDSDVAGLLDKSITDLESIEAEKEAKKTKPRVEYREMAYAFSGKNPQGQTMSLASIPKGKVVLLDFWASWCAPCRATNPNLVRLYNTYKDRGFTIMSISEDKGEAEWINAIHADNLTWPYHVLDKNKSIAFRYGVESIPFKILIDKQGLIASEKISGSALESRLVQLLNE